jgi:hypothetical protein
MFDWCFHGDHNNCHREYERFYVDAKNKIVFTGEMVYCQCKKRGCKCYVPAKDRAKKKAVRRKQ